MVILKRPNEVKWNNIKARAFFYEDREVIDLVSELSEIENIVIAHHESPIGETLLDFCEGFDSSDCLALATIAEINNHIEEIRISDDFKLSVEKLMAYLEEVMLHAPYFSCLYALIYNQMAKAGKLDFSTIAEWIEEIERCHYEAGLTIDLFLRVNESGTPTPSREHFDYETKPMWLSINSTWFEPLYLDGNTPCILSASFVTGLEYAGHKGRMPEYTFGYVVYPEMTGDLINFIVAEYIKRGVGVKKCKNCGRDFVSQRNNQVDYCDRVISNTGKTCRQLGAIRVYQNKQNENPVMREYNKSYKTHNARIRYGTLTKEAFADWSVRAREMRKKCMDGEITLEQFVEWLKD